MQKGFSGLMIFVAFIAVIFIVLFLSSVASVYPRVQVSGIDPIGLTRLFGAFSYTFANFAAFANTIIWTMVFFAVQGIFIYGYYKLIMLVWVHVPQFQKWFNQSKALLSK